MIKVKDVKKMNKINKNLEKIDKCLLHFSFDGGIHKLMLSFKEFYFKFCLFSTFKIIFSF